MPPTGETADRSRSGERETEIDASLECLSIQHVGSLPRPCSVMNRLYVGFRTEIELHEGGCVVIDDTAPRGPQVFDPLKHSFDPLKDVDPKKAREIADVLYTISPQGQDTLTVRNGRRALAKLLTKSFQTLESIEEWLWKKADEE